MEHTVTPPHELVQQWAISSPIQCSDESWAYELFIAHQAARWGADQELEACCEWLNFYSSSAAYARDLRATRRPKPPSLRKQAYDALDTYIYGEPDPKDKERTYNTIRQALEALPND